MTTPRDLVNRRGVLLARLELLGEPKEGEDPQRAQEREETRAKLAALSAEIETGRLPFRDEP